MELSVARPPLPTSYFFFLFGGGGKEGELPSRLGGWGWEEFLLKVEGGYSSEEALWGYMGPGGCAKLHTFVRTKIPTKYMSRGETIVNESPHRLSTTFDSQLPSSIKLSPEVTPKMASQQDIARDASPHLGKT